MSPLPSPWPPETGRSAGLYKIGRSAGLSLIEVLVTLFVSAVAFGLIFTMARAQARVYRHQQTMERFLVDADACFGLLESDLSTAFAVTPSSSAELLRIGHLMRSSVVDQGQAPFNSQPFSMSSRGAPVELPTRGTPLLTTYTLTQERIDRSSSELLPPNTTLSQLPVLDGVNSASAAVDGAMVTVRLTLLSQTRAQTVQRVIFAPGLTTR